MTPQEAHARAVTELADLLARAHDDPHDTANRYIGGLVRAGWRPVGALADRPGPARAASPQVALTETGRARLELERKRGHRPELGDACTCRMCGVQREASS